MIEAIGRALLFDIDGTLANTDPLHLKAFNLVLGPRGHVFDHARFSRELQGFANVSIGERFLPDEAPERRALILDEKEEVFRTLVAGQIEPLPGLMALLDRADAAGIPMVAVTNAPRLNAELLLSGLGITHRFKALVIGAELLHGKPHPLLIRKGCALPAPAPWPRSRSRTPAPACNRPQRPAFRPSASGPASTMLISSPPGLSPPPAASTIPIC
ncbi:beta-phosphoglucomutase-like phosphatase (HAD superfamily) [Bradyrhizobium sp. GM5.1]